VEEKFSQKPTGTAATKKCSRKTHKEKRRLYGDPNRERRDLGKEQKMRSGAWERGRPQKKKINDARSDAETESVDGRGSVVTKK